MALTTNPSNQILSEIVVAYGGAVTNPNPPGLDYGIK